MRTQQEEEQQQKDDEHPPPFQQPHHNQTYFGDMAVVLEQHLPQSLEPGFGLGGQYIVEGYISPQLLTSYIPDYQYGDPGELGTPPDGPPVLTNSDQSVLNSFFSDPNGLTSNLTPYDTGLPQDYQGAESSFGYQFGSLHHAAGSGPGMSSLHKPHVNGNNMPIGHTENWNQPPAQQHMNADDISAASTIHNLKAPTPTPNYSGLHVPGISASWGNFAMPTPIQNNSAHIPTVPGQPQLRAVPTQTRHHSFTYPTQPLFTQNHMYPPSNDAAHGPQSRQRQMSYSEQPVQQWANFQQPQYQAGQGVSFGTDASFTGRYFSGHRPHHEDKEGNLLQVPGAESARPQAHRTMSDQRPNGSQGQDNSRPSKNGGSGAPQWNSMNSSRKQDEGEFAEPRDRKRRKSQVDDQGEGQFSSAENGRAEESMHKRRKSSTMPGMPDSPDDFNRAAHKKKMRETLTDAEKRKHHIMSEKKRRELIHGGFKELESMVPCLQPGKSGLSRSEVLQEIASYLETLKTGNIKLASMLQSMGHDTNAPIEFSHAPHIKTEEGVASHVFTT